MVARASKRLMAQDGGEEKQLERQLDSWQRDVECIAEQLPIKQRQEAVVDEPATAQRYAEPGSWPVLDAARIVSARPALSANELAEAERDTDLFLASLQAQRPG